MNRIEQTITLRSRHHFGRKVPMADFGDILGVLQPAARKAIRMAFEGRSTVRGNRPDWLKAASDLRFLGIEGKDETILHFEAPLLGEAAAELYSQQEIWETRPDPTQTGIDLLAGVTLDIASGNRNSERYDRLLLNELKRFEVAMKGSFDALHFPDALGEMSAVIDQALIAQIKALYRETPPSQPARIYGTLDMIRKSTQAFALKLPNGEEIKGLLVGDAFDTLSDFMRRDVLGLGKDILVLGKAVFRASGQLLRIDADTIVPAGDEDRFFAKVPTPRARRFDVRKLKTNGSSGGGVAAIIGKWPGDESDEVVRRILEEIG